MRMMPPIPELGIHRPLQAGLDEAECPYFEFKLEMLGNSRRTLLVMG